MDKAFVAMRANGNMKMNVAPTIVTRKDGVEVHSAPFGARLPASQPGRIRCTVSTEGIRLPNVYASTLQWLAGRYINDLHGKAEVDALLVDTDVLALELAFVVVWTGDVLGRGDADRGARRWLVIPVEAEKLLVVFGMLVFLVAECVPLCEGGQVWFDVCTSFSHRTS